MRLIEEDIIVAIRPFLVKNRKGRRKVDIKIGARFYVKTPEMNDGARVLVVRIGAGGSGGIALHNEDIDNNFVKLKGE
jgi:hypothetical protein